MSVHIFVDPVFLFVVKDAQVTITLDEGDDGLATEVKLLTGDADGDNFHFFKRSAQVFKLIFHDFIILYFLLNFHDKQVKA